MRCRSQLRFQRYLRRLGPTDTQPTFHSPRRNRIAPLLQGQRTSAGAEFGIRRSARGGPHEQAYSSHPPGMPQRVTRGTDLPLSRRQRGEM